MTRKKHTTKITYKSIAQSLAKDYKKSLAEYIWNGFDASASNVAINFQSNELGFLYSLNIIDNGLGIDIKTIEDTFGNFLDSQKKVTSVDNGLVKGKSGKGRFSFINFCTHATWKTTFKDGVSYLSYDILLFKESLPHFDTDNTKSSKLGICGTTVEFYNFFDLSASHLEGQDFFDFITSEFGWYLYLNENAGYSVTINGKKIDFNDVIDYPISEKFSFNGHDFDITFIKWKKNIGDKYYFYFLNDDFKIVDKQHTSFNNKIKDFHHSVYISSKYFDSFTRMRQKPDAQTLIDLGNNNNDNTFKALVKYLNKIVGDQEKLFIRNLKADELINNFKKQAVFPKFRNNAYDKIREKDLEAVVKEIYCLSPKIFQGLKVPQSKTLVGFLNLLLDSEQRENIITILESLIDISDEERMELATILKDTKISHITALISDLKSRFSTVSILKTLVFKLEKFTNERDHIQKVVENNYWLFGEQYHLVSADVNFETSLNNYLAFIEQSKKDKTILSTKSKLKRPDIFIARKIHSNEIINDEYSVEENIIVELKRPSIVIGKEQFDQIEEYIRFILAQPEFNGELRRWKLILVGKSVDDWIIDKYESQSSKGKKFLVEKVRNYEIYAFKWDDIFRIFEIRHNHLIQNLEFKDEIIQAILEEFEDKELPSILTKAAVT